MGDGKGKKEGKPKIEEKVQQSSSMHRNDSTPTKPTPKDITRSKSQTPGSSHQRHRSNTTPGSYDASTSQSCLKPPNKIDHQEESMSEFQLFKKYLIEMHKSRKNSKSSNKAKKRGIENFLKHCSVEIFEKLVNQENTRQAVQGKCMDTNDKHTQIGQSSEPKHITTINVDDTVGCEVRSDENTAKKVEDNANTTKKTEENREATKKGAGKLRQTNKVADSVEAQQEPDPDYECAENDPREAKTKRKMNDSLKELQEDLDKQKQMVKKLKRENDDLSTRLAKEMSNKVSADESAVENVSIRNRPMNVADEYSQLCTNEWLAAKNALDDMDPNLEEHTRLELLHVYKVAEEEANKLMDDVRCKTEEMMSRLSEPSSLYPERADTFVELHNKGINRKKTQSLYVTNPINTRHTSQIENQARDDSTIRGQVRPIPVEITNAIGDYLRNTVEETKLEGLQENVHRKLHTKLLEDKIKRTSFKDHKSKEKALKKEQTILQLPAVTAFVNSLACLAWKMVIQRPPMIFKYYTKYEKSCHELFWGSKEVEDGADAVEVHPVLYHGKKVMVKGKVYVMETIETNTAL